MILCICNEVRSDEIMSQRSSKDVHVGDRFGKLIVVSVVEGRPRYYHCKCDCGHCIDVRKDHLLNGSTVKCHWCPKKDYSGQVINGLKIIQPIWHDKSYNWKYLIKCTCGKTFESYIGSIISGHTRSCGHLQKTQDGLSRDPRFRNWEAMIQRMTNPNHKEFKYYDEMITDGPKVDPDWLKSPKGFFEELGPKPHDNWTVDRIDNSKGYVPGNVRWASKSIRQLNRRALKSQSKIPFVYRDKRRHKWIAYGGRREKYLGQFDKLNDAKKAQDEYNSKH